MRDLRESVAVLQPLRQAAFEGDFCKFRILCREKGIDVNEAGPETGRTALHWGAYAESNEIVSYLLNAKKAEVDPLDADLNTPLNILIQVPSSSLQKKLAVIDTLLAHGADPLRKNRSHMTPLMNLIELRDKLPANRHFQFKNINAMIVKIKENIYQKAARTGQVVHIHQNGQVVTELALYDAKAKPSYLLRQVPPPQASWRRHF